MPSENTTSEILSIFRKHGGIVYGERCSVLSHSIQAGLIAQNRGCDDELVLAAFLHDIGHLCPLEYDQTAFSRMGEFGIEAHDRWAEAFLRERGFSERLIATVKNHVAAKRYLCFSEAAYYEELSEASKNTLRYQGGPMSEQEAKDFEQDPFFEDSLVIRKIDEAAKEEDFEVREAHWTMLAHLLQRTENNGE